jgi:FtsP/CotA-like multicopper oxidase with cupredoxin domain
MSEFEESKRLFLKAGSLAAGSILLAPKEALARIAASQLESIAAQGDSVAADRTLHIEASPIEIAPKRIISATTYNGQFPGPLLRFHEGQQITVDIFNDSDTPEQLHWHGQKISTDVDGAAEEARHSSPHMASGASRLLRTLPVSAFITRIIALAQTFTLGNTAAK